MTIQYPKINNSKNITKIIKKLFFILLGDLLCALAFNVFFYTK